MMDINSMIKDVVSKILYNSKGKKPKSTHKVYNKQVEKFLNRSHDVESFDFGKAWIVDKPGNDSSDKWISELEREIQFNLKNGLTN